MNRVVRERVRTVVFMVGLTAVVMTVVMAVQISTAEVVERNRTAYYKRAILEAAGVPCAAGTPEMLAQFDRLAAAEPAGAAVPGRYRVRERPDGPVKALVFKRTGVGLWGKMTAMIALNEGTGTVVGIVFIDQNETPGLGARISEPWFTSQFKGKRGPFRLVPEGQPSGAGEINAITGATITTRGVQEMVEKLLDEVAPLTRKAEG